MIKFIAVILISLTALIRAYHLPQELMFAEDQEDLAWRVKQIAIDKQPTLISGKFSQIGIYLPPGYLYFLVPFFLLTNFHPQAAMIVLVTLSALTSGLLIGSGLTINRPRLAIIAWFLYTFSPLLHTYDRLFWQPNLILPAASLAILSLIKLYQSHVKWLFFLALACALSLQAHPQGFILTFLSLVIAFIFRYRFRPRFKHYSLLIGFIFLSVSPLILFELRHGFVITKAFLSSPPTNLRSYYWLFLYPAIIWAVSLILSSLKFKAFTPIALVAAIIYAFPLLKSLPTNPPRPDGLLPKLTATNNAVNLITTGKAPPRVQFNSSAAGFKYLFWYVAREKHLTQPITFYESWDQVNLERIVIQP